MNAMMKKALLTGVVSSVLISGCASSGPDSAIAYKSDAPAAKRSLEVPPDLSAPQQQDRYPLPVINSNGSSTAAAEVALNNKVAANAVVSADQKAKAQIERAGSQRWISVEGKSPAQLWPLLKAFWQDNGFVIQTEEPDVGLMETDWAENRAKLGRDPVRNLLENIGLGSVLSTPERDRFRIRVEQSATGTDVFFTHRGMYEIYINEAKDATRWQPRPADPELEAVFLSRFLVRLGVDEATVAQNARKLETAANPATSSKVRSEGGDIILADSFERSWRRVGLALERQGLAIVDRDRSMGVYFVSPVQDEALKATEKNSGGIWSSLAFWQDKEKAADSVREQLRIELKPTAPEQTRISIRNSQGTPLSAKQLQTLQQKLLNELQ